MHTENAQASILDSGQPTRPVDRGGRGTIVTSIDNHAITISGTMPRIARVRDEPFRCIDAPEAVVDTFMQELSDRTPKYRYLLEWDSQALLPITTYDQWWKQQIDGKSRNMVRKAQKGGLDLRTVTLDDTFVLGIADIYDETPIRQGKRFVHCGKDFETLKRDHATFLDRTVFIGAYAGSELVGFAKLVRGRNVASLMQIISKIKHRDKAPSNALVAKAVELCSAEGIPCLHYGVWSTGGLGMFKTSLGFVHHEVPRYYVPLNPWGQLLVKANMHHKWTDLVPNEWRQRLAPLRKRWNSFRYGAPESAGR
jgi:hypothetical protein